MYGPPSNAPVVAIEESPAFKRGQHYDSASEERLPNMEQRRMPVVTNEDLPSKVLYQIVEVSRP